MLKKPGIVETVSPAPENMRVSDAIANRLNFQIATEFEASQVYRAMATWCEYKGLESTAKFMHRHADEEIGHMNRVKKYAIDRNCLPVTPAVKEQQKEFKDLVDILNKSYAHEIKVTKTYEDFAKLAVQENDYTTFTWIQWYLREQVEEENIFKTKLDRIKSMAEQGLGTMELDEEMSDGPSEANIG